MHLWNQMDQATVLCICVTHSKQDFLIDEKIGIVQPCLWLNVLDALSKHNTTKWVVMQPHSRTFITYSFYVIKILYCYIFETIEYYTLQFWTKLFLYTPQNCIYSVYVNDIWWGMLCKNISLFQMRMFSMDAENSTTKPIHFSCIQ